MAGQTINEANRVFLGDQLVNRVYVGSTEVWPEVVVIMRGAIPHGKVVRGHFGRVAQIESNEAIQLQMANAEIATGDRGEIQK